MGAGRIRGPARGKRVRRHGPRAGGTSPLVERSLARSSRQGWTHQIEHCQRRRGRDYCPPTPWPAGGGRTVLRDAEERREELSRNPRRRARSVGSSEVAQGRPGELARSASARRTATLRILRARNKAFKKLYNEMARTEEVRRYEYRSRDNAAVQLRLVQVSTALPERDYLTRIDSNSTRN